jgi:pimeloyl-ACP methyl ester carboxylesterase
MDAKVERRSGSRRAYADAQGGLIHYRYAGLPGGRSPLLLLHPVPSSSLVYETFMAEIGRDRTVIAPDLPGYGMSDAPEDPPSIADYASAMLALEAKLGLGLLDVMGYHTGGLVAAEMARQQPSVVRKIVMIGAFALNEDERSKMRQGVGDIPLDQRASGFAQGWTNFKNNFWRMGADDQRRWSLYVEAQRAPQISWWGHRATADYDLAATLAELAQPILVLNPDDDLRRFTDRVSPHLKTGRVHSLPDWTHGFIDAEAAETGRLVRAFLDG